MNGILEIHGSMVRGRGRGIVDSFSFGRILTLFMAKVYAILNSERRVDRSSTLGTAYRGEGICTWPAADCERAC